MQLKKSNSQKLRIPFNSATDSPVFFYCRAFRPSRLFFNSTVSSFNLISSSISDIPNASYFYY